MLDKWIFQVVRLILWNSKILIEQRRSKKCVLNLYNVANYINVQIHEHFFFLGV